MYVFKTKEKSQTNPLETAEQEYFTHMVRKKYPDLLWFHPANESKSTARYRSLMANRGLLPGISDIVILTPGHAHQCGLIELKRRNGVMSDLSDVQKEILRKNAELGHYSAVAFGVVCAMDALEFYLTGKTSSGLSNPNTV